MTPSHIGSERGDATGNVVLHRIDAVGRLSAGRAPSSSVEESLRRQLTQLATLAELVSRIGSSADTGHACRVLADDLASTVQGEQVVVAICRGKVETCEVAAVSGISDVNRESEHVRFATAALQECIVRGELSLWPNSDSRNRHALLAHQQFAERVGTSCVVSMPLEDDAGVIRGAYLIAGDSRIMDDDTVTFLRATEQPLASALGLLMRAEGHRVERFVNRVKFSMRGRKGAAILASLAVVALMLLCPFRYRVSCDCELQPVVRRFVAAPFEGRLETSLVEPGDLVSAGDVLARIDGRDIHWELSGKQAELHRVTKERDGYLATHQSGKVGIASLEMDRLQLDIEQLQDRSVNLDVRSPIDGMVVLGDLSKSEGVPLEKGQSLFEIAPLEQMVIEVSVPEEDVRFVEQGLETRVSLDAYPMRARRGNIERVHPRAELKDHENVFIAELSIENKDGRLRPGMRGQARISTVRRPLGWILFHKAVAASITWLGW